MSSRIVGAVVGVAVASAVAAGPARAQYGAAQAQQRPLNFEVGAGPSVPLGSADKALTTGFDVLAAASLHGRTFPIGLRGGVSYQRFGAKTGRVDPVTTIRSGNGQLSAATLDATFSVLSGSFRPYVLAGVGYYDFRSRRSVSQIVGGDVTVVSTLRQSDSRVGFNAGLGMRGGLGALDAFLEVRLDDMRTEAGAFGSKRLQVVPVTLGFRF